MDSDTKECPNADAILAYANKIGVKNAELVYEGLFGWILKGEGRERKGHAHWPLVWRVCDDLNMGGGCGSSNQIQINPHRFLPPEAVRAFLKGQP